MGLLSGDEFRLLFAVLLNVLTLWAAWRLARRLTSDRLDAAGDALGLYYLVQYLAVCLPGVVRALHPLTIGAVALLASGVIGLAGSFRWGRRRQSPVVPISHRSMVVLVAAMAFGFAYVCALLWQQHLVPVMSNDAMTYHLPAAVQWLQNGRLGIYPAWYYNPANSWSPLAGSAFLAWLIAPVGHDALARFVQVGPAILLFFALLNLCRRLGTDAAVAALIAAACVLARPFISQTVLAKDDLFVAAFFVLLVDSLSRERLGTRAGPWRAGVALGMLLAMKYTVLLSLPILVLMLRRPRLKTPAGIVVPPEHAPSGVPQFVLRASLRLVVIISWVLILAAPWYLRNWRITGNPLYPTQVAIGDRVIFPGMLSVGRSDLLKTASGAWEVFTGGYYGTTVPLFVVLAIGWGVAVMAAGRRIVTDSLVRTVLLGPVVGIAIFVLAAPYGEMRFAYPSLALLFAAAAVGIRRLPWAGQVGLASAVVLLSAATAFVWEWASIFTLVGVGAAGVAGATFVGRRIPLVRIGVPVAAATVLAMGLLIGVFDYIRAPVTESTEAWKMRYELGPAWGFVRKETPRGATVAYANTFFTYPLMGFGYDHKVAYAPTRSGLERFEQLPRIDAKLTGEQIVTQVVAMLRENPNRDEWLRRLKHTGADYLLVAKQDPAAPGRDVTAPEMTFAQQDPQRFQRVYDDPAASVFKINW